MILADPEAPEFVGIHLQKGYTFRLWCGADSLGYCESIIERRTRAREVFAHLSRIRPPSHYSICALSHSLLLSLSLSLSLSRKNRFVSHSCSDRSFFLFPCLFYASCLGCITQVPERPMSLYIPYKTHSQCTLLFRPVHFK